MEVICFYTYVDIDDSILNQYINEFVLNQQIIVPESLKGEHSLLQEELAALPLMGEKSKELPETFKRIKKHLHSVKCKIGENHEYAIAISTRVATLMLSNLLLLVSIEQHFMIDKLKVIQSNQRTKSGTISISFCRSIIDVLKISLHVLKEIDSLSLEYKFKNKVLKYYIDKINSLSNQFYIDTRNSKEKTKDALITTGEETLGCIVKIIIALIVCYGLSLIFAR